MSLTYGSPLSSSPSIGSPKSNQTAPEAFNGSSFQELDPLAPDNLPESQKKDFAYLLRPNIFHPLSQIEIPSPLRTEFPILNPGEPLSSSLGILEKSLSEGRFLVASHFAGAILTSSLITPTDTRIIFALFYIRLACLELSGNTVLAAQESKALEDLNSAFYYLDPESDIPTEESPGNDKQQFPRHIVPWPLRVLAVRLQSIGFGDPRRSIGGLYEIGLEARREIMRKDLDAGVRKIWRERLEDLGMRSVNALVEMGDLDAAKRSLEGLRTDDSETGPNRLKKALLLLRIGDTDAAEQVFGEAGDSKEAALMRPLLSMSDGRYTDAVSEWQGLQEDKTRTDGALIAQNLAVCLLYAGELDEVMHALQISI